MSTDEAVSDRNDVPKLCNLRSGVDHASSALCALISRRAAADLQDLLYTNCRGAWSLAVVTRSEAL